MPALIRPLDVELHEGARQLLIFPRSSRLAGPQPHDSVIHPKRLARLQGQIADDAVTLVEQAEHRDAVGHWRDPCLLANTRTRRWEPSAICLLLRLIVAPAPRQKQQCHAGDGEGPHVSPASRADNRQ